MDMQAARLGFQNMDLPKLMLARTAGQINPLVERIYLTRVHASPDGDAFFFPLEGDEWREGQVERYAAGPEDDCDCSGIIYERCKPAAGPRRHRDISRASK